MLTYFMSASNDYTIRTVANTNTNLIMSLQNMQTQNNTTASLSGVTINDYESMLSFTASISGAIVGGEYRATIYPSGSEDNVIWNGTINVFASQSLDKPVYKNQIPLNSGSISHVSDNSYIIYQ